MIDEIDAETIQEYERLSFDVWFQVNNFAKEILGTIKAIREQQGILGSEKQQQEIISNINEFESLIDSLIINRKNAVVSYDWEGLQVLKDFVRIAENLLSKYPLFLNDKLAIRDTIKNVVQEIKNYLILVKDDDYYRKQTGTDWLPSKINFDSSGRPTQELSKELSKEEKESLVLFAAIEQMKKDKKSTYTLSREDLDETAQKIIQMHRDTKKRIEHFWKILKEGGE